MRSVPAYYPALFLIIVLFYPEYLPPSQWKDVGLLFLCGSSGKYLEAFAVGLLICLCYVLLQNRATASKWNVSLRRISPLLLSPGLLVLFFLALWHFNIWYHHYVFHSLDRLFHYYDWLSEFVLSIGFALSVAAVLFGPA